MTIAPLEIGTQSNPGRFGQDGAARLINCYAEAVGKEGKQPVPVYGSAGLQDFATLTDGGVVRAMLDVDNYIYVVAGRAIYRVDTTGTGGETPIGGLPSDGPVTMARNRKAPYPQICVTCDGIVKFITNGVVSELTDSDLPPPNSVTFLDGYFVWTLPDGRFYWSAIDEGTEIDALDFASAEANPDGLLVGKANGRVLVLFGPRSREFHVTSGEGFVRQHAEQGGCFAAGSVCEVPIITGDLVTVTLAYAATDAQGAYAGVCILDGYSARKISNHAVDRAIRDEPDPLSITSCSWSDGGHGFYNISGSTFSWTHDTSTGQWHERKSYGLERWKVRCVQQFAGQLIAGDYTANKLYRMRNDFYDEAGEPLIFTIQTPPVHAFPQALEYLAAHIDIIPGVGLESGADEDVNPTIEVAWSDDGGKTWKGNRRLPLGRLGDNTRRAVTRRLGQGRPGGQRTFRFSIDAAVAKGVLGAALDVNELMAA